MAVLDGEELQKSYDVQLCQKYSNDATNFPLGEQCSTFTVTFKNPCVDESFVKIEKVALNPLSYIVDKPDAVIETHPVAVVTYSPNEHTLCGDLSPTGRYDGSDILPSATDPIAYDPSTRTFSVLTTDGNLIDQKKPYAVFYQWKDYPVGPTFPDVSSSTSNSEIDFINPCLSPFTFKEEAQATPPVYDYSGADLNITITPFTVTPVRCIVDYEIVSVTK